VQKVNFDIIVPDNLLLGRLLSVRLHMVNGESLGRRNGRSHGEITGRDVVRAAISEIAHTSVIGGWAPVPCLCRQD
jgi:hypothetical protein